MKSQNHIALPLPSFAAGLLLSLITPISAAGPEKQDSTKEAAAAKDEITATGTVFSVEPDVLSVVMKDNATPVRFAYDKSTPFLDENGTAVPMDLVRGELPLTVYYLMDGEKMVAHRVVVSRSMIAGDANAKPEAKREELAAEKAQENSQLLESEHNMPQEVTGSVAAIEQTISIVARGEKSPTSCIINNSTRFVNLSGVPVSPQMLMSGMPVTIKSVRDGKRVIAQEIIIRGGSETMPGNAAPGTNSNNNGSSPGTGKSSSKSTGATNGNRNGSGGANGFNDLLPVQGYILPSQAPGQTATNPATAANSANAPTSGNQNQTAKPTQPNTNQNGGNQPNTKQPNTKQPATAPAGGTQKPGANNGPNKSNENGSKNGTDGNNNGNGNTNGNQGTNKTNNGSSEGSGGAKSGTGGSGGGSTSGGSSNSGGGGGATGPK